MSNDTFKELRVFFDGNDQFMNKGHRILKRLRREKDVPAWTLNNILVKKVLIRSFPNLLKDPTQKTRAARWFLLIDLYFRQRWSRTEIAAEMKISYPAVDCLVRNILRAGEGRRSDGDGTLGRPKGRPRRGLKKKA